MAGSVPARRTPRPAGDFGLAFVLALFAVLMIVVRHWTMANAAIIWAAVIVLVGRGAWRWWRGRRVE